MIFILAKENTNKCRLRELPSAEIQVGPTWATAEPCQMAGNKEKSGQLSACGNALARV
jgi:hypothetical protein